MHPKAVLSLALTIIAAGALPVARATPITYSDRGAWQSQVTSSTTVDFEGIAPYGSYTEDRTSTGFTISGATFVGYKFYSPGVTDYFTEVRNPANGEPWNFGTGSVIRTVDPQWSQISPAYILVQFPSSTAIGFDVMTFLPAGSQYARDVDIWLSDGEGTYYFRVNTYARTATPAFFGLVSPTAFTSVRIQAVNAETILDNFAFGTALGGETPPPQPGGETPEVATAILIISGLIFLRFGKQKFGSEKTEAVPA